MAKILLVEDDNNLRDIYGERLMAEGYDIISASDGEEALQMAAQQKPDLIISDVMMPKISGFDMLDILRQTPETKDVKIIMMTALSQSEDKMRADKLGANKYLVKSQVTLEDVARVVHDLLGDTPAEDSEPVTNEPAQTNPTTPATVANEPTPQTTPVNSPAEPFVTAQDATFVTPPATEPTPPPHEPVTNEPAQTNSTTSAMVASEPAPQTTPVTSPAEDPNKDLPSEPIPSTNPATTTTPASTNDNQTLGATTVPVANPAPTIPTTPPEPVVTSPTSQVAPDNTDSTTPIVNPISGATGQAPSEDNAQQQSDSSASTTDQEMADVQKQIENFVAQEGQVSEHTEPVKEPSEQDLIHAKNANEDPKVVPAATAKSTNDQPEPLQNTNPTVPPIIKPQVDTANPEPASNRKKIIQPLNDVSTPDIHRLYEQQMAEEAANTGVNVSPPPQEQPEPIPEQPKTPSEQITPQIQEEQVFNPISTSLDKPEEPTPELETVDVNSITGIQDPEEDDIEVPIPGQLPSVPFEPNPTAEPAPSADNTNTSAQNPTEPNPAQLPIPNNNETPAQQSANDSEPPATEKPLDPNDPNNFAL